jgi:hypothetical protein
MKLYSQIEFPEFEKLIRYDSRIAFLGSCFSDEIGKWLESLKFQTLINPYGITYNPVSIAQQIRSSLSDEPLGIENIQEREGLYFHPDVHSSISKPSHSSFLEEITDRKKQFKNFLGDSDYLFLTFGTSIAFRWKKTNAIVNNCHRMPSAEFDKTILSEEEMYKDLKEALILLFNANTGLQIVLTVSPIRHLRHGAIQNQRSKARLIRLCEMLESEFEKCTYLPIYELVMDELRDYRFYRQDDLIHLNDGGLEVVKDRFMTDLVDTKCFPLMRKVESWQKAKNHRVRNPKSDEAKKFWDNLISKTEELNELLDGRFEEELKKLKASREGSQM